MNTWSQYESTILECQIGVAVRCLIYSEIAPGWGVALQLPSECYQESGMQAYEANQSKSIWEYHLIAGVFYVYTFIMQTHAEKLQKIKEWKQKNKEKVAAQKKRYNLKHPNYYREYYLKNGRSRAVDYQEAIIEWRKNHPEALVAHKKLNNALKYGKIKKPKKCSECRQPRRLSAHHDDYSKPLEVVWLCWGCHKIRHQNGS